MYVERRVRHDACNGTNANGRRRRTIRPIVRRDPARRPHALTVTVVYGRRRGSRAPRAARARPRGSGRYGVGTVTD